MSSGVEIVGMAAGEGLAAATDLLESIILPCLRVDGDLDDGRWVKRSALDWQVVTTDLFAVQPLEFPGGDLGKLAAAGCVNDLLASGAIARMVTVGLFLSSGLHRSVLARILTSFRIELDRVGAEVICGDTKVYESPEPGMLMSVTGIGDPLGQHRCAMADAQPGDCLIVTGPLGAHTVAVLSAREGLGFEHVVHSDVSSLVEPMCELAAGGLLRSARDLTRGGLVAALWEGARASGRTWRIDRAAVPVDVPVSAATELLGLDPLTLTNEGRMLLVSPPDRVEDTLTVLRQHRDTASAVAIGRVMPSTGMAQAVVAEETGVLSVLPYPEGIGVPRLC